MNIILIIRPKTGKNYSTKNILMNRVFEMETVKQRDDIARPREFVSIEMFSFATAAAACEAIRVFFVL